MTTPRYFDGWNGWKDLPTDFQITEIKPWSLDILEPLRTKAPCPDKTRPWCCYVCTVIFYVGPQYIVRPWHHLYQRGNPYKGKLTLAAEKPGHHLEEWGRCEYLLPWDTLLTWSGQEFTCGGGQVIWRGKGLGWWMKHWARRKES